MVALPSVSVRGKMTRTYLREGRKELGKRIGIGERRERDPEMDVGPRRSNDVHLSILAGLRGRKETETRETFPLRNRFEISVVKIRIQISFFISLERERN